MPTPITTRSYDNARTGVNPTETVLITEAVQTQGIKKLFSLQMTGDARGIEAQPLVLPVVAFNDGTTHDVVYLVDMANQIWAFDAGTGTELWKRQLGTPINGTKGPDGIDRWGINDHWGVLGTPVVDAGTGTMYLVAWISSDGSVARAEHFCYAVSVRDGSDVHAPISLEGVTYAAGHGAPEQRFVSAERKQRAGLLLTDVDGVKTVFIGFGSINETSGSARGWVIACATDPLEVSATWASTAKGFGGGIWQGAGGMVADSAGFIYAMTGNGTFDGEVDFAESFIKLQYKAPARGRAAQLSIVDWWTPFSDAMRTAGMPPDPAGTPTQTNYRAATGGMGGNPWSDMDLGSAGPVVIEEFGAVLGAGKDGIAYVLHQNNMGKTKPADLTNPAGNYGKLMAPAIFFTYYPPNLSPDPQNIQTLNLYYANQTHHLHGSPVSWNSPDRGPLVYCWGENGNLRAWSIKADGTLTYLACSAEWASADVPDDPVGGPKGGMPGGMLSLSANGTVRHTGVVWATIPYLDANMELSPGRLLAYDATEFEAFANGSGQLRVLWDSQDWDVEFTYNKFNHSVVFDGKLFVPTYDDRVDVYGLA